MLPLYLPRTRPDATAWPHDFLVRGLPPFRPVLVLRFSAHILKERPDLFLPHNNWFAGADISGTMYAVSIRRGVLLGRKRTWSVNNDPRVPANCF